MTIALTEANDTFWSLMRTLDALPALTDAPPGTIIGVGATTWLKEENDHHRLMIESPRLLYASTFSTPSEAFLSEWIQARRFPPSEVLLTYAALIEGTFSIDLDALPWIWTVRDGCGRTDARTLWALHGGVAILPDYHANLSFSVHEMRQRSGVFHPQADSAHARLAIQATAHRVRDQAAHVLSSVGSG